MNELQLRLKKGKNRNFRTEYADFMQNKGESVTRWPVFGGKKLDLQAVYEGVTQRGGFDAVTRNKQWKDIARILDTPATCTSASFALKQLYQKWLLSFEEHKRRLERAAGKAPETSNGATATLYAPAEEKKPAKSGKQQAQASNDIKEEDVFDALLELGEAEPPPKRQKLEMASFPSLTPMTTFQFVHLTLRSGVNFSRDTRKELLSPHYFSDGNRVALSPKTAPSHRPTAGSFLRLHRAAYIHRANESFFLCADTLSHPV